MISKVTMILIPHYSEKYSTLSFNIKKRCYLFPKSELGFICFRIIISNIYLGFLSICMQHFTSRVPFTRWVAKLFEFHNLVPSSKLRIHEYSKFLYILAPLYY